MAGETTWLSIAAGDWLQASAGFFGVIATIAATLFIERHRGRQAQRRERQRFEDMAYGLAIAASKVSALAVWAVSVTPEGKPLHPRSTTDAYFLQRAISELIGEVMAFNTLTMSSMIDDLDLRSSFLTCSRVAERAVPQLERLVDELVRERDEKGYVDLFRMAESTAARINERVVVLTRRFKLEKRARAKNAKLPV